MRQSVHCRMQVCSFVYWIRCEIRRSSARNKSERNRLTDKRNNCDLIEMDGWLKCLVSFVIIRLLFKCMRYEIYAIYIWVIGVKIENVVLFYIFIRIFSLLFYMHWKSKCIFGTLIWKEIKCIINDAFYGCPLNI